MVLLVARDPARADRGVAVVRVMSGWKWRVWGQSEFMPRSDWDKVALPEGGDGAQDEGHDTHEDGDVEKKADYPGGPAVPSRQVNTRDPHNSLDDLTFPSLPTLPELT
jgi:hypothetical protein